MFQITKELKKDCYPNGRLIWDETFRINTSLLGAEDTVILKLFQAPLEDVNWIQWGQSPEAGIGEGVSRSNTMVHTNATTSFYEDPNLLGISAIRV